MLLNDAVSLNLNYRMVSILKRKVVLLISTGMMYPFLAVIGQRESHY